MVVAGVTGDGPLSAVFWDIGMTAIPVAVAIAILRYRLFDVDLLISRTLVYGLLTVLLGAAYAGLVLAGQAVFSSFAGGSNLAIAVSTLVVAALFLPLRSRVQRFVDRRFYRRRYDAARTLEAFGARLRAGGRARDADRRPAQRGRRDDGSRRTSRSGSRRPGREPPARVALAWSTVVASIALAAAGRRSSPRSEARTATSACSSCWCPR